MEYRFETDLNKRKEYLKVIAKSDPTYLPRMICFWIIMLSTVLFIIEIVCMIFTAKHVPDTEVVVAFYAMIICLACAPFFIGLSVKNTAKYKCAAPFSGMTNNTLILTDSYLEFHFWKASKEAPAAYSSKRAHYAPEDKFVYRFDRQNIKVIKIGKDHICRVAGEGIVTVPDWASSTDAPKTKKVSSLDIVTCFTDNDCESKILSWHKGMV